MARRRRAVKRVQPVDPKFNSELVARVIRALMKSGKKTTAERIVYGALEELKEKTGQDPIEVMDTAIANMKPKVEVKSRRVGGATFQVPTEIRPARKVSISIKNMILYSRKRSGKSMSEKLSAEIVAAYNQEGAAYKRKEDMHKMADANRAFAHFRF